MKVNTIKGSEIDLVPGVQLDGEMLRDLDLRGVDLAIGMRFDIRKQRNGLLAFRHLRGVTHLKM